MRTTTLAKLARERDAWNARYPVGTPVEYWTGERGCGAPHRSVTTHPATVTGGSVVAWVRAGISCIGVSHVQPLMRLRCKTVYQPYASAFAAGLKTIETNAHPAERYGLRSGDLLAIHAAQRKLDDDGWALARVTGARRHWVQGVPTYSAVVGIVRYLESAPVVRLGGLPETERALGDYSPGRFGWRCELVHRFAEPVPAKGFQGVWWWEVPAECRWWEERSNV